MAAADLFQCCAIFLGEFTGTALLLYFGCLSMNVDELIWTHAALEWGFTVSSIIMAFGHITKGHFNPVITLCAVILGLVKPITALVYFAAQMLGAVSGFYLIYVSVPKELFVNSTSAADAQANAVAEAKTTFCLTTFRPELSVGQGLSIEFIATTMLVLAACSAWDPRNAKWGDSIPLKFAFVVAILIYAAGPLTGASMNPARSFAPAFVHGVWKDHWAYWVAPFGASLVTSLIYKYFYLAVALRDSQRWADAEGAVSPAPARLQPKLPTAATQTPARPENTRA